MANLIEAYKKRLAISEAVYSKSHNGEKMDNYRKMAVAKVLENTNKFLNEAFSSAEVTQRSAMGDFKKFCLNLTTVSLPNLIANDLVIVHPMSSISGYVTYIEYMSGNAKGDIENEHLFNSPFQLGDVKTGTYTSDRVVEAATAGTGAQALAWTPIVHGAIVGADGVTKYDVKLVKAGASDIYGYYKEADKKFYASFDGTTYSSQIEVASDTKVAYVYDNIIIPQNDLPVLKAEMKSIPLIAKARRIAVYYSQIAAFQAKTDYGFDLGDQLAEQAVGQLSYEIDTEVVGLLDTTADENTTLDQKTALTWSKTLPVGVSKTEHYQGFTEIVERGRQFIYDATKKFAPNYMIISSSVLPVLTFINGFTAAPAGQINGPYLAGTLNSLKVFVSPAMAPGEFCIGCNGNDMMSSVAVYAPYMAIIPTQLLQYADGGTSQGWSTMYDLKVLNKNLIVKGKIVD